MKNGNILGIILLVLLTMIFCSQERNYAPSVEEQLESLKNKVNLTEEQVQKIKPIIEERNDKMRELRKNFEGERSEIRESMMNIRQKADDKIKDILTTEQVEKYNEFLEEQRNNRRRSR